MSTNTVMILSILASSLSTLCSKEEVASSNLVSKADLLEWMALSNLNSSLSSSLEILLQLRNSAIYRFSVDFDIGDFKQGNILGYIAANSLQWLVRLFND